MTLIRIDGGQYLAALLALSPVLWKAFVYSKTVTSQTRWSRKVLRRKSILKYYKINAFFLHQVPFYTWHSGKTHFGLFCVYVYDTDRHWGWSTLGRTPRTLLSTLESLCVRSYVYAGETL